MLRVIFLGTAMLAGWFMARAVRQPVVLMKWYRVVSWMLDRVDHFPKNQRFVFGQRLAERSIHVLELLVEAAWSQDKTATLAQANREMEVLRWLVRLAPVIRDADGRIIRIRYVLPRHKAANWVGPGRGRKSTRPGANGVVELSPFEFLDRLADLVPPPRKHRHRYHGVFAPNHRLRKAVTALAIGNVSKQREATTGGDGNDGRATGGCCDTKPDQKPGSHDTSRIAWAKLLARVGEEFPLECPACGGDIRLIAFKLFYQCETIPGLRTVGNFRLLRTSCPRSGADPEDPHASWRTARAAPNRSRAGPSDRLVRARPGPGRPRRLSSLVRRAARDRHPQPLTGVGHEASKPRGGPTGTRSAPTREKRHRRIMHGVLANRLRTAETTDRAAHESSVSRKTGAEVQLTGLSFLLTLPIPFVYLVS
jgi:hypothetical protein